MIHTPFKPQLTATVISCEEGGYTAFCPEIKGAISEGETEEEAVENLKDAILGVLAVNAEMSEEYLSAQPQHRMKRPPTRQILEFA